MTPGEASAETNGDKVEGGIGTPTGSTSSGSPRVEVSDGKNKNGSDGVQTNEVGQIKIQPSAVNPKHKFFIDRDDDLNRFQENKMFTTEPRSPSAIYSDYNGEVVLRRPYQNRNRGVSAVVAPNKAQLGPRKTNSAGDLEHLATPGRLFSPKSKKENMVLQLIVPSGNPNMYDSNNYLSPKSIDDILDNGQLRDRPRSMQCHQDFYPPPADGGYMNRTYSTGDLSQYRNGAGTPGGDSDRRTTSTPHEEKPTPPEEKKRALVGIFTIVFCIFYTLFNVTLGVAIYVSDVIHDAHTAAEVFSFLLVIIAFLYILYLSIDIAIFMKKKRQYEKLLEQNTPEQIEMKETPDGRFEFNITLPQVVTLKKTLGHPYCFNKDRHSTNFYLKIGAAAFCFGHLIHSGLILGYQLVFLTTDQESFEECGSVSQIVLDVIYPLYSFLLLFFIFKYSNVIINKNIILARFGVMHCLSASICFWIWTIFRETVEAIRHYRYYTMVVPDPAAIKSEFGGDAYYKLFSEGDVQVGPDNSLITPRRFLAACDMGDPTLSSIYRNYSPYLYPFSVEFSILVVGILYLVWKNIGMCKSEDDEEEHPTRECKVPSGNKDNVESNIVVHVDCHSSNKGLFGGFMVLVLAIVSIILLFIAIYTDEGRHGELGLTVNVATNTIILFAMTIASIFGYLQIVKLDLNTAHYSYLDDVLLFICIPPFFLNAFFSIVPAFIFANILNCVHIVLEVVQVLIQTCFILDGMRRSSHSKEHKLKKPGREMLTFLMICNVSLWIMQTFQVKSHGMQDNRYEFYGKELWSILGHISLPLMMFYRFHASVCLADIWKYAYEPSGH